CPPRGLGNSSAAILRGRGRKGKDAVNSRRTRSRKCFLLAIEGDSVLFWARDFLNRARGRKAMPRAFQDGDRVRNQGRGPIMLVMGYEGSDVVCSWYETGQGWKKQSFAEASLRRVGRKQWDARKVT